MSSQLSRNKVSLHHMHRFMRGRFFVLNKKACEILPIIREVLLTLREVLPCGCEERHKIFLIREVNVAFCEVRRKITPLNNLIVEKNFPQRSTPNKNKENLVDRCVHLIFSHSEPH